MSNITLVRRNNLLWLMQQFLKEAIAGGSSPKGLEQEFAAKLQISPSMLSQIKSSRPIGDTLARQVERLCGKAGNWLDEEHAQASLPSAREERFIELARQAWRRANAQGKRELMKAMDTAAKSS